MGRRGTEVPTEDKEHLPFSGKPVWARSVGDVSCVGKAGRWKGGCREDCSGQARSFRQDEEFPIIKYREAIEWFLNHDLIQFVF